MLRLSTAELGLALAGLSPAERLQLLQLLQQREELAADAPEDTRPPLESLIERDRQQSSARSDNPEQWLEADAAHWACHQRHYDRLVGGRRSDTQGIDAWMEPSLESWAEAGELAAIECPPPASVRVAEPEPGARDEAMTLPRAVQQDVEWTRARRGDERLAALLRKVGVSNADI